MVVQIISGCLLQKKRGACNFCTSFNINQYKEKNLDELKAHIKAIKDFYGKNINYINYIFLADADPLYTECYDTKEYLKILNEEFPNIKYECFISTVAALTKKEKGLQELKDLGLNKVYWGVESADDYVLKILNKPQRKKDLVEVAKIMKRVNLEFTPIIMTGLENFSYSSDDKNLCNNHIKETSDFINSIACKEVYLSKFQILQNSKIFEMLNNNQISKNDFENLKEDGYRNMIKSINCEVLGAYGNQFF
ncbi:MAG TPA: radical SAM protein [Rickettsiales bacterium]|nr:radical SAM protein [Rickettsiales bacterium]